MNCHDLKDRTRYDRLPPRVFADGWGQLLEAWSALGTEGRIMAMATLAGTMDAHKTAKRIDAANRGADDPGALDAERRRVADVGVRRHAGGSQ